jgi:tetratricopeptide (TPR) repeat protein
MKGRRIISGFFVFLCLALWTLVSNAETILQDSIVYDISINVFENRFETALSASAEIKLNEPNNPLGHFLTGAICQIISEKFRNDSFEEEIDENLERAIDLCDDRTEDAPDNPDWYFIAGASYGYRGLDRALHGGWWGAFRDGMRCKSNLNKAIELDSTYYDAYLGLGSYYYYRTIKSKDFLWLPFISDNREKGMAQIKKAIDFGHLSPNIARQSFLRIYLIEKRYNDLISLSDSLYEIDPNDAFTLLYFVEGLIAIDSLELAETRLNRLRNVWRNSSYCDSIGIYEEEYLLAKIAYRQGDNELAQNIIDRILSHQSWCRKNAYFDETYDKAKKLSKKIR